MWLANPSPHAKPCLTASFAAASFAPLEITEGLIYIYCIINAVGTPSVSERTGDLGETPLSVNIPGILLSNNKATTSVSTDIKRLKRIMHYLPLKENSGIFHPGEAFILYVNSNMLIYSQHQFLHSDQWLGFDGRMFIHVLLDWLMGTVLSSCSGNVG